jgi:dihydrofolate synthase / folylpolyglutamate synthase
MNYRDAIAYLSGIRMFGQQLGLERMQQLLDQIGHPERTLRFIHIAGTNGKGSVAAMCHSILTAAGYRTGLYTSPHLVSVCERFQINQQPISEDDLAGLVERFQPLVGQMTFFEVLTAMALQYFHDQRVDVVVWEVGLGGRLDATNIVTPLVSIITNIALDHTQYLGSTIPEIAAEKCGIIKPGIPVVTAATGEALDVIRRHAPRLIEAKPESCDYPISLLGAHQTINRAVAVAALKASGLSLSEDAIRTGLAQTRWPGRFQIVSREPLIILDGAHNAAGAETLAATLCEQFPGQKVRLVLGALRDKDCEQICRTLAPLCEAVFCVPLKNERANEPSVLAQLCRVENSSARVLACASLDAGITAATAKPDGVTLIAGSLYLIGEALAHLTGKGDAEVRLQ